jgi:hypothetical protein
MEKKIMQNVSSPGVWNVIVLVVLLLTLAAVVAHPNK